MQKNGWKTLLLDTCGENACVALSEGDRVMTRTVLPLRGGSAEIVGAIDVMLKQSGWELRQLDAVGVVSGPGSFTGVRVGMATAKGLCEASGVRMIAVSRLVVLADAVRLMDGFVALDAGRGELYVGERAADGAWREWLGTAVELSVLRAGRGVYVCEVKTAELLTEICPVLRLIAPEHVLQVVLSEMYAGAVEMTLADANYVRRESDIYGKPAAAGVNPAAVVR